MTSIDDNTMYIKMVQLRKKTQSTTVDACSGRRNIWFKKMNPLPVIIFLIKCLARSIFNDSIISHLTIVTTQ